MGPFALNNRGQVVGFLETPPNSYRCRPFFWEDTNDNLRADPSEIADLGVFGQGYYAGATDINEQGGVTGYSDTGYPGGIYAFYWEDVNDNGISDPCEMINLGTLGGDVSEAHGINHSGQVVGLTYDTRQRAFLWQDRNGNRKSDPEETVDLGCLEEGGNSMASGINDAGQIVGISAQHPFLWEDLNGNYQTDPCEMIDLGILAGNFGRALDINASGQVVGETHYPGGDNGIHAFLWEDRNHNRNSDPGEMIDLDNLGNDYSWAKAINDHGQVVGVFENRGSGDTRRAFYWDSQSGMVSLMDLLATPREWTYLMEARDINNRGEIVGWGITTQGERRAFLMVPAIPGDMDHDLDVDVIDFALLSEHWLETGCEQTNNWCGGGDINHQDDVGPEDLDLFVQYWLSVYQL